VGARVGSAMPIIESNVMRYRWEGSDVGGATVIRNMGGARGGHGGSRVGSAVPACESNMLSWWWEGSGSEGCVNLWLRCVHRCHAFTYK
jgi:hypothetical protein